MSSKLSTIIKAGRVVRDGDVKAGGVVVLLLSQPGVAGPHFSLHHRRRAGVLAGIETEIGPRQLHAELVARENIPQGVSVSVSVGRLDRVAGKEVEESSVACGTKRSETEGLSRRHVLDEDSVASILARRERGSRDRESRKQ